MKTVDFSHTIHRPTPIRPLRTAPRPIPNRRYAIAEGQSLFPSCSSEGKSKKDFNEKLSVSQELRLDWDGDNQTLHELAMIETEMSRRSKDSVLRQSLVLSPRMVTGLQRWSYPFDMSMMANRPGNAMARDPFFKQRTEESEEETDSSKDSPRSVDNEEYCEKDCPSS